MSTRTPSSLPSITARPSPEEKAQFVNAAAARGVSESALALSAIRSYLGTVRAVSRGMDDAVQHRTRARDRITIRLRPGDGQWIARRAQARGMTRCAYLAALVRAHVSSNPPIPEDEIQILKRVVSSLGELGRAVANQRGTELTRA